MGERLGEIRNIHVLWGGATCHQRYSCIVGEGLGEISNIQMWCGGARRDQKYAKHFVDITVNTELISTCIILWHVKLTCTDASYPFHDLENMQLEGCGGIRDVPGGSLPSALRVLGAYSHGRCQSIIMYCSKSS